MNPHAYLKSYRADIFLRCERWSAQTQKSSDYTNQKLKKAIEILDENKMSFASEEDKKEFYQHVDGERDYKVIIQLLEKSLITDIKDCTNNFHSNVLDNTALGILPFGETSAYCSRVTKDYENLDGHIIIISEGLYIGLQLLSKAIVIENLINDLEEYKQSGAEAFEDAIRFYKKPNPEMSSKSEFQNMPADINGEVSAFQSSVAMMIMKFTVLHEFAHAVHGDCDVMNLHQRFMLSKRDSLDLNIKQHHDAEYSADLFALEKINLYTKTDLSAWDNFKTIYLFFHWIHYFEQYTKQFESASHPPPLQRAEKLYNYMLKNYKLDDNAEIGLKWIRNKTEEWYQTKFGEINEN